MSDLLKNMANLNVGKKLDSFTGVVVHAGQSDSGDELNFAVGSSTGYVLDITNPIGTKEMAAGVLAGLKLRGYRYQPYEAQAALLDPASEIGDNVTVNGTSSIIFNRTLTFTALMPADIGAPFDEEVNHAFKYEAAIEREFKRESKYTRSRIKQNKDSIQLEVIRATDAESALGARIDLRVNSISLSVSGTDGTSVFKVMDGSTTLSTTRFDISVKAMNVNGQLTASQIAAGAISVGKLDSDAKSKLVTSSQSKTQYYLSTSDSTATGGSWGDNVPSMSSGKYIWTREKTTVTYIDNSTDERYSPSENGRYNANLTNAISESQIIYRSIAGGSAPSAPSSWVTDSTGGQNKWTNVRPEYNQTYPALYVATQKKTTGGLVTCTAPALDATTTVIDGASIITGSINANKIAVTDLSAFGATIGGWNISSTMISKGGGASDLVRVRLLAPESPGENDNAIAVAYRASTSDSFANKFYVTYGGKVTCSDIKITGGEVGGASVEAHSFGGITIPSSGGSAGLLIIPEANLDDGAVTEDKISDRQISSIKFKLKAVDEDAIDDDAIVDRCIKQEEIKTRALDSKAVTDAKVADAINTNLGYAAGYHTLTVTDNPGTYPSYFKVGTLRVPTWAYINGATIAGYACSWKYRVLQDTLGNDHSEWVMTGAS